MKNMLKLERRAMQKATKTYRTSACCLGATFVHNRNQEEKQDQNGKKKYHKTI